MAEQRIKIPRANDKTLVDCFKAIASITDATHASITTLGFIKIGDVNITANYPEALSLIVKNNSAVIDTISMPTQSGFSLAFERGGRYRPEEKSAVFDEIILISNNNRDQIESAKAIEIIIIINQKLKAFDPKRSVAGATEEQAQYNALHNTTIQRLESLNEDLISKTHDYRLQLDKEFTDKKKVEEVLNAEHRKKLEKQYIEKETELKKEADALESKKKELDDSSNTHARREIRKDILKEIKKRQTEFKLTAGTNQLRIPIAVAMLFLILFFASFSVMAVLELGSAMATKNLNIILVSTVKQVLYSIGTVASIIFMIRWMNRWFESHSQAEFALKNFELDMERASWLVETSLEWKDAKGTAIPTELLESLSASLFDKSANEVEQLQHPADQLASALLGSASSIKLKAGDSSVEIDPKKLAKQNLPVNKGKENGRSIY